ncbi:uncharacterized protein LOC135500591 [Lineus longissimus]|uniref:uncharacterized protein LOC135500591 n=1 Tax=Lineus longissimus TaxID=88925 RepID=UPI00315C4E24
MMLRIDEEDLVDSVPLTCNEETTPQPPRVATPRTEIAPVLSLPPPPPPVPSPSPTHEDTHVTQRPQRTTTVDTQTTETQILPDERYTGEHSPETGIRQTYLERDTLQENRVSESITPRDPRERRPHPVHPAALQNGHHQEHFQSGYQGHGQFKSGHHHVHKNGVSHLVSHYENQHHPYGHQTALQGPYHQPQGHMNPGNRAFPYYAGNPHCGHKVPDRNSKTKSVDTSCIVQILIGLCTTSNAVVMVIYKLWHIGAGFWCSAFFIASGVVGILSNIRENRKLRRWNIALCLLNLCIFYIALVVSDVIGLVFDLKHAKSGDMETLIICLHSINVVFSTIGMTSAILQITPKTYPHNPYSAQSIHEVDSRDTQVSSMLSSSKTSKQKYHLDKDAARLLAPPASPNSQHTGSQNSYPFRHLNGNPPSPLPQLGPMSSPKILKRASSPPHQIGPLPNPIVVMRPPGSPQFGRISPAQGGTVHSPSQAGRIPSPSLGRGSSPVHQTKVLHPYSLPGEPKVPHPYALPGDIKVPHPYSVPGRSPSPSLKYSRVPSPAGSRRTHSTSGSSKASTCTVRYQKSSGSTPPPPYCDETPMITHGRQGSSSPTAKVRNQRTFRQDTENKISV